MPAFRKSLSIYLRYFLPALPLSCAVMLIFDSPAYFGNRNSNFSNRFMFEKYKPFGVVLNLIGYTNYMVNFVLTGRERRQFLPVM